MSIEDIQSRLQAKAGFAEPEVPSACQGCPNLVREITAMSRPLLTCALERAGSEMQGPIDMLARDGIGGNTTARWLCRALTGNNLNEEDDRGALTFRFAADKANDECPIIKKIIKDLASASPLDVIDIAPPEPLTPGGPDLWETMRNS
jgi:hypothetical protein